MVSKVDFEAQIKADLAERITCPRCDVDEIIGYPIRIRDRGWLLCILCIEELEKRLNRLLTTFFKVATARGDEW